MKANQRKKSFLAEILIGVLAMVICISMLALTTFAWFTDEVTSNGNRIVAGNLDLQLLQGRKVTRLTPAEDDGEATETVLQYTQLAEEDNMFNPTALWEPGYTEDIYFSIRNAGSVALKYQFEIEAESANFTNINGETVNLMDALVVGWQKNDSDAILETRGEALAVANGTNTTTFDELDIQSESETGLLAGEEDKYVLVGNFPEDVANTYNWNGVGTAPSISLSFTIKARQMSSEEDSYGNDYDTDSDYYIPPMVIVEGTNGGNFITNLGPVFAANRYGISNVGISKDYSIPASRANMANPVNYFSSSDGELKTLTAGNTGGILRVSGTAMEKGTAILNFDNIKIATVNDNNSKAGIVVGDNNYQGNEGAEADDSLTTDKTVIVNGGIFETNSRDNTTGNHIYGASFAYVDMHDSSFIFNNVTFIINQIGGTSNTAIIEEYNGTAANGDPNKACTNNSFIFNDCTFIFVNGEAQHTLTASELETLVETWTLDVTDIEGFTTPFSFSSTFCGKWDSMNSKIVESGSEYYFYAEDDLIVSTELRAIR
jgi:predicted ribosomally synthesized peptide with SipW-like signal peptide